MGEAKRAISHFNPQSAPSPELRVDRLPLMADRPTRHDPGHTPEKACALSFKARDAFPPVTSHRSGILFGSLSWCTVHFGFCSFFLHTPVSGRPVVPSSDTWRSTRTGTPGTPHRAQGGDLVLWNHQVPPDVGHGSSTRFQAVRIGRGRGCLLEVLHWPHDAPIKFYDEPELST